MEFTRGVTSGPRQGVNMHVAGPWADLAAVHKSMRTRTDPCTHERISIQGVQQQATVFSGCLEQIDRPT